MTEISSPTDIAGAFATDYEPGNEADFNRLYESSYGKILGTLTAMLGDRAAALFAGSLLERASRGRSALGGRGAL